VRVTPVAADDDDVVGYVGDNDSTCQQCRSGSARVAPTSDQLAHALLQRPSLYRDACLSSPEDES